MTAVDAANPITVPPMPLSQPGVPVGEGDRIQAIDALRGFALLGILILNIQSFAMPGVAYINPTAYGDLTGWNLWVWRLSYVLGDQKFMTIFSMLFGAGIVIMTGRAKQRTGGSAGLHYRRMGWMILFGLLHAHLLWYGDILYFYGMCGLAVYLLRNLRPGVLLIIGLLLVAVGACISLLGAWSMQFWSAEAIAGVDVVTHPPAADIEAELQAYRSGWFGQLGHRIVSALMFETFMFALMAWRVAGLMLVGMALYKWGFFAATRSVTLYVVTAIIGLGAGLPIIVYGVLRLFEEGWRGSYVLFLGGEFNYWGSILVSMAYASLVMLMWKTDNGKQMLRPFVAVGQMAFTNYLMQTVICTLIFYGHGLGYFGSVERTGQLAIVVGVWIVQFFLSPLWLKKFRFGPAEWLWRSLTYWRPQPMLRRGDDDSPPL